MTFNILKYPQELNEGQVDYVTFTPHEYRSNRSGETGPQTGSTIILYMPNSTPSAQNANSWGEFSNLGPVGAAKLEAMGAIADIGDGIGASMQGQDTSGFLDSLKKQAEAIGSNPGGVAKQVALKTVGNSMGFTSNQILSLTRGEVYNPNVELTYNSPARRAFSFSFQFIPKSQQETQMIHRIIKHLKSRSAPEDKNGMFKIPDVWMVKYMSDGGQNKNMNVFKKMACTDISVQANASSNMHQSFSDGMPISTTMSITFQEIDIITRNDHEGDDAGLQGF